VDIENYNFEDEKFLVADDDLQTCMILERVFQKTGVKTRIAKNGIEALKILKSDSSITLAIIDIRMPKLDGYQVVEQAIKFRPDIIYIAYTADVFRLDRDRCANIGFHSCLSKPLLPSMLVKALNEALLERKSSVGLSKKI
jgi:CheY-like chemotaxis protein